MAGYEHFAPFYDEVMDDPTPRAVRVIDAIDRHRPEAASLLELGCGTGSMLERLGRVPALVGLDRSPEMLAIAGGKVPRAELVEGDMSSFSLDRQFDVVICVFDTLNHLLTFDAWLSSFDAVAAHLAPGGLFIFDVNTIGELRRLGEDPAAVYDFDGGVAIIDVSFAGDGVDSGNSGDSGDSGDSLWDIRIFEDLGGCRYRLHHEQIGELGVRLARLTSAIQPRFEILELSDERGAAADDDSIKAHFVLRQPPGRNP
ncbi:MAG: class I SAM-dependent DNA methyltransferase [Acidimicrobiales bacterium]